MRSCSRQGLAVIPGGTPCQIPGGVYSLFGGLCTTENVGRVGGSLEVAPSFKLRHHLAIEVVGFGVPGCPVATKDTQIQRAKFSVSVFPCSSYVFRGGGGGTLEGSRSGVLMGSRQTEAPPQNTLSLVPECYPRKEAGINHWLLQPPPICDTCHLCSYSFETSHTSTPASQGWGGDCPCVP